MATTRLGPGGYPVADLSSSASATIVSAPFYVPRPGPVDFWSASPAASSAINALTTGAQPKTSKVWRSDYVPDMPWLSGPLDQPNILSALIALKQFSAGGQVLTKLWRYDVATEYSWLDAPQATPIMSFPAVVARIVSAPFYAPRPGAIDFSSAQPSAKPRVQSIAATATQVASAPFYAPRPGPIDFWLSPSKAQSYVLNIPPIVLPFAKLWRYDFAVEAAWQGSPDNANTLVALSAQGTPLSGGPWTQEPAEPAIWAWSAPNATVGQPTLKPFATPWQPNLAAVESWQWTNGWASDTLTALVAGGAPFAKQWRYDVAPEYSWQWANGWSSDTLTTLVVGGKPFARLWRYDVVPQPDWNWTPPNGTIDEPLTGVPFGKLWRYDFAVDAVWQGAPVDSPIGFDLAAKPLTKLWRYDVVAQPDWSWEPANVSAGLPVAGNSNVTKLWRYDLGEQLSWQWTAPNGTAQEPKPPFFSGAWQSVPPPDLVWQGVPIKASLSAVPPFFSQSWRSGPALDSVWQGAPTKTPLSALSVPFATVWWPTPSQDAFWRAQAMPAQTLIGLARKPFAQLWRYDFDDHTNWAWVPPNATIDAPEVLPPIMPLWWRENLVPEPYWQRWSTKGLSILSPNVLIADPRFVSFLFKRATATSEAVRKTASLGLSRTTVSTLKVSMPRGPDFYPMDVGETVTGAIDFSRWIPTGVTIVSVVSVTLTNVPTGGSPCIVPIGTPQIGGAPIVLGGSGVANVAVLQQWQGVVPGVARVTVTIGTSDGQTLIGWAHQTVSVPN